MTPGPLPDDDPPDTRGPSRRRPPPVASATSGGAPRTTRWGSAPAVGPDAGAGDGPRVRSEVRLRMKPGHTARGVAGAWWPRSPDPSAEFPELVLALSSWVGPVGRVTYHIDDWGVSGSEVVVDGWPVELVASSTLRPHTVTVVGTRSRERNLLVIPPRTPGAAARAVLRSMAGPDEILGVEDVLTTRGAPLGPPDAGGPPRPGGVDRSGGAAG
ncbi:DUF5994 family protein [Actinokineospora enzanensis]|uniref:DUF5994 family protein n=1 Tax=Actinokineospora enzanensis TaxID=155975 RepID=UPI000364C28C|nr:DUF5994 family protein [Actinokineospora enzanensis]